MTTEDYVDVTLHLEKKTVVKFALNYRALIKGKWHEVYRVDNFHGFLHEQRFWISREPMPLTERITLNQAVEKYTEVIAKNFKRYRRYLEATL